MTPKWSSNERLSQLNYNVDVICKSHKKKKPKNRGLVNNYFKSCGLFLILGTRLKKGWNSHFQHYFRTWAINTQKSSFGSKDWCVWSVVHNIVRISICLNSLFADWPIIVQSCRQWITLTETHMMKWIMIQLNSQYNNYMHFLLRKANQARNLTKSF